MQFNRRAVGITSVRRKILNVGLLRTTEDMFTQQKPKGPGICSSYKFFQRAKPPASLSGNSKSPAAADISGFNFDVATRRREGFGKHHHQANLQFCRQARGSLVEMRDHLNVAEDEGFSNKQQIQPLRSALETTLESLNGSFAYIRCCVEK